MEEVKIIAKDLPEGFGFSIGDRFVKLDANLSVEDAKLIESQHSGYVQVVAVPVPKGKKETLIVSEETKTETSNDQN